MTNAQIYPASRKRALLMLLVSPIMLVMGGFLWPVSAWLGGFLLLLGLLALVMAVLMLIPGKIHLKLDEEGIWIAGLSKHRLIRWNAIATLGIIEMAGNRLIAIEYHPNPAHHAKVGRQANWLSPQVLTSDIYTTPIDDIVAEMQRRLAHQQASRSMP